MTTTLKLDKYKDEYLLQVHISRPGRAGYEVETTIDKETWLDLKAQGITDLTEY